MVLRKRNFLSLDTELRDELLALIVELELPSLGFNRLA